MMCDSRLLPTGSIDNKMPPDVLLSAKSRERWTNSDSGFIHPDPECPNLDMKVTTTTGSSSVRPNSASNFQSRQLTSSQLSFEDVQDAPFWRSRRAMETETFVNHVNTESSRNLEQHRNGKESESAPSTDESEQRPLPSSAKNTEEVNQRSSPSKTKVILNTCTGSAGRLEPGTCTRESEGTQKYVTCAVNGERTSVKDNAADDDKQNFFRPTSRIEIETGLDVSADSLLCYGGSDFETRSRLEPCKEIKTGFYENCESETGFNETHESKTSFDENCKSETGFNKANETEPGFDKNCEFKTGFSKPRESETGFGTLNFEKDSRLTPSQSKFDATAIETVTHELLQRTLCHMIYDPQRCRIVSHDLAGQIMSTIIGLAPKRYKLVIFVSIGSLTDSPGVQFGSRCLWDADTDQLATVRYANKTLFAVVMVYGLYRE